MDVQLAERLQKIRKEHGYSQEQLADKLNVSRQAVSKWERGEASPDTDNLIALARLYDISVDDLLFEKSVAENVATATGSDKKVQNILERRHRDAVGILSGVTVLLCCIVYFLLGGIWSLWHPAWIIFFAVPVTPSLVEAIYKKDPNIFSYPVLVTGIYLLLGCVWRLWHPWWVVFLTIPVYYVITDFIKKY